MLKSVAKEAGIQINKNIRCIEIGFTSNYMEGANQINKNIRCIEILVPKYPPVFTCR